MSAREPDGHVDVWERGACNGHGAFGVTGAPAMSARLARAPGVAPACGVLALRPAAPPRAGARGKMICQQLPTPTANGAIYYYYYYSYYYYYY